MERDNFRSKTGFIIACIGSAVGMGNIWLFPARVSAFGGAAFLIPYFICVLVIGVTGVVGEMAFGRAMGVGPMGAFGKATDSLTFQGRLFSGASLRLPLSSRPPPFRMQRVLIMLSAWPRVCGKMPRKVMSA